MRNARRPNYQDAEEMMSMEDLITDLKEALERIQDLLVRL